MRRQPFDLVRASFWLVAGIMGVYALDLLLGLLFCGYINATHGTGTCNGEKLGELLATLLATAVAFAGGLMRDGPKPYDRPPDEPRPGPIDEDKKPGGGDGEN
jgi:hypothetical protein